MAAPRSTARDPALADLATRVFDAWMEAEPEEATSIGLAGAPRLRDPSPDAEEAAARVAAAALRELSAIEQGAIEQGPLGAEDRLDAWAIRAHATERVRAAERGHAESRLEAVPYAVAMLAHAAARATSSEARRMIGARIHALPAHVDAARAALARGVRAGRPFSIAVAEVIADQLASAPQDLAAIVATTFAGAPDDGERPAVRAAADAAASAILRFAAFLREVVVTSPGAVDVVPLGEAEYERRLAAWWQLGMPRAAIARRAREELERAQDMMLSLAARVAPGVAGAPTTVKTFADAKRVVDLIMAPRPGSAADVVPLYEQAIARATAFCRERGTFAIPEVCRCEVVRAPELWRRFAHCTNWPAPLLGGLSGGQLGGQSGGDGGGACAVVVDPALHPLVAAPNLAVHEAIPGHFLQSRAWQIRFGRDRAPVRFLGVPDECGVLRDAWIPHFMIEGWAVFTEARMEEAGFHDAAGALFHAFCRTIHAARALADIGLHTEGWTRDQVASFSAAATGMPAIYSAGQGVRYARSGLQALGYLFGRLAIEDVREREKARRGDRWDELSFHASLLDAGPAPPALLGDRWS